MIIAWLLKKGQPLSVSGGRFLVNVLISEGVYFMKVDDFLFGRRIRQNHALEHATITILSQKVSDLSVSARSSSDGFIVFGDVDLGELRHASEEALSRLQAGEAELAIHPNCGTNLAVGVSLVTLGT